MISEKRSIFMSFLTVLFIIVGVSIIYSHVKQLKADEKEADDFEIVSSEVMKKNVTNQSDSVMKTKSSTTTTTTETKDVKEEIILKGKKILCIGDSMTFLDNKTIRVGKIIGYQQAFRNEGAFVDSYGISGSTFKQYSKEMSRKKHGSLYDDVAVKKKANVKDHDYITIFAGTNDISTNFIIGDRSSLDNPKTTLGGFNLLLKYLTDATDARIVVFSPIYTSDLEARPKEEMEKMIEEMQYVAKLNQVEFVDIYHDFEINQKTSEKYLYDRLHPNNEGMKVLGAKMVETLKIPEAIESPKKIKKSR